MAIKKVVHAKDYAPIDIDIDKGRDFHQYFAWLDENNAQLNMTGYQIAAELRIAEDSGSTLIDTFTIDTTNVATGEIYLDLTEVETAAINATKGFYDIKVTDTSGITKSWVKGKAEIHETVTG